jgi:2-phospho-L-lactate guanylyltransferase
VHPSVRADLSSTWALVPIRGLESAKTRLGGDLDAEERVALVTSMLRRTLQAARDARRLAGTIVVTMDGDAAELAGRQGAIGLVERAPGLNEAIEAARSVAIARGATAVLVLPADLPAVSSDALDALLAAADQPGDAQGQPAGRLDPRGLVAVVADRHGAGTNALLLAPPDVIAPAFGGASRLAHASAAAATGARFVDLDSALALDVDTSADLLAAEAVLGPLRA